MQPNSLMIFLTGGKGELCAFFIMRDFCDNFTKKGCEDWDFSILFFTAPF